MEKELKELVNLLFEQLNGNKKNGDYRYYELFSKINRFVYELPIIKSDYVKDLELSRIMTFIEQEFKVPMLAINKEEWIKLDNNNKFILSIYDTLSNLRSI